MAIIDTLSVQNLVGLKWVFYRCTVSVLLWMETSHVKCKRMSCKISFRLKRKVSFTSGKSINHASPAITRLCQRVYHEPKVPFSPFYSPDQFLWSFSIITHLPPIMSDGKTTDLLRYKSVLPNKNDCGRNNVIDADNLLQHKGNFTLSIMGCFSLRTFLFLSDWSWVGFFTPWQVNGAIRDIQDSYCEPSTSSWVVYLYQHFYWSSGTQLYGFE